MKFRYSLSVQIFLLWIIPYQFFCINHVFCSLVHVRDIEGFSEDVDCTPSAAATFIKNLDIRKSLRSAKKTITKPFKNLRKAPEAEGEAAASEGDAATAPAEEGGIMAQAAAAMEADVDKATDAGIEVVAEKVEEVAIAGAEKVEGVVGGLIGGAAATTEDYVIDDVQTTRNHGKRLE